MKCKFIQLIFLPLLLSGCFPYMYHDRGKVLLKNIDIDQTLKIAEIELESDHFNNILTLWAIRDQLINSEQATIISELYFKHIDRIKSDFGIWHIAWAISNFYRLGDDSVKKILQNAYDDAKKRPEKLKSVKKIADEHINGSKIYMGDVHSLGRFYAKKHIVIPGNKKYVQSFDDYMKKK